MTGPAPSRLVSRTTLASSRGAAWITPARSTRRPWQRATPARLTRAERERLHASLVVRKPPAGTPVPAGGGAGAAGHDGRDHRRRAVAPGVPPLRGRPQLERGGQRRAGALSADVLPAGGHGRQRRRSEEHTSELQSRPHLVCRLLLEKKKNINEWND